MVLYHEDNFEVVPSGGSEIQKNSLMDKMVGLSKSFVNTFSRWTPEQKSLFVMCLTKIRWTETGNSNVIELSNREIMEALQLEYDSSRSGYYLRNSFKLLMKNSLIEWTDKNDSEIFHDGFIITGVRGVRGKKIITFNPEYMPLLEGLQKNFITVWTTDAFSFKTAAAWGLFLELRMHCDTRRTNYRTYRTAELKEIMGIKEGAYTRKSDGGFNRYDFEKKALEKAIEEINDGDMITIHPWHDQKGKGVKFYKKEYESGYVSGYTFRYSVKTRQAPTISQRNAAIEDAEMEKNIEN